MTSRFRCPLSQTPRAAPRAGDALSVGQPPRACRRHAGRRPTSPACAPRQRHRRSDIPPPASPFPGTLGPSGGQPLPPSWRAVIAAADPYLDSLGVAELQVLPPVGGPPPGESVGTLLLRVTAHYWFHNGEAQAIRQLLGQPHLPDFVGAMGEKAPYRPEPR